MICSKGIKPVDMLLDFTCCFSLQITALHCVYFGLIPIQFFTRKNIGTQHRVFPLYAEIRENLF